LVTGPAAVTVLSGRAEVFGFQTTNPYKIVIREGKRLPFTTQETTHLWVSLGPDANLEEVNENTVPPSWNKAADIALKLQKKPATIMVIGGVDTGKTGFCTYLTNKLVSQNCRVAVLDEDVGQSDIGPPCTVAYTYVSGLITDLFNLREQNAVFVGSTSPGEAKNKIIEAATSLKAEILSRRTTDFVVVNTDGWVLSEEAIQFKAQLAKVLEVDTVFCLQSKNVMHPSNTTCRDVFTELRLEIVEAATTIRERTREKRRTLRELSYAKYLKNAKIRIFSTRYLTIEDDNASILNRKAENLIVGIYCSRRKFLGIGIINKVDYIQKSLKISTPVTAKPSRIVLGKIRLDMKLHEIFALSTTAQVSG
jgi:polynucleotide 5'-hydroxyl-kinase GRC3/NOL9